MNRTKLIKKIASQLNLNEIEVGNFIGSVFDTMAEVLRKGKNINIPEFGKFIVREKKSEDASYRYITFSPSKKFADEINKNFSGLSPVLTKALNINDLTEIKIVESDALYGDEDFVSFVFEDTETDLQLEVQKPEKESNIVFDETEPVPEITEEIPLPRTEETIEDFHVPFLIPVLSPIVEVPKPAITPVPEIKKAETPPPPQIVLPEPEIASAEETSPEINEEPVQADLTVAAADTIEEEQKKVTEVFETEETLDAETSPEDVEESVTEQIKTEDAGETEPAPEESIEKEKIDILEERILSEKEIILKDIEDYLKSKKETEETEKTDEEKPEEKTDDDKDNYFKKSNVYGVFDSDNDFAADEMKNSGIESQNVFFEEDFPEVPDDYEFEKPEGAEPAQNVFEDISEMFEAEHEITDEDDITISDKSIKYGDLVTEDTVIPVHEPSDKKAPSLKDSSAEQDINDEILSILASREKAINELNKYGLILPAEETPKEQEEPEQEIEETEISGKEDTIKEEAAPVQEIPEITFERKEFPEKEITPEKPDRVYDELNKKLEELNELTAEKESLEERIRDNVTPEMTVFEKLVEEKPQPVTEKPMTVFPDIIIHDPGDKYEDKIPKSLNEALEDVKLDGVIEHLEHHDVIEEKSYDDVFKPADIPFVPVSSREFEIKKQKKILKFLLYFFFVAVLSILSFFLYKSVLTPPKRLPVDTLGTKVNDSVTVKINPVDSSLRKSSINLNEFEVEKEGDIIYKQNDNGFIIQIAKFDKYSEALKYVTNLDNKNIHAEIERVDLPLNVTEYRIIVGTFETLQDAKSYFKTSGMMLNFIKIMTPFKTALPF